MRSQSADRRADGPAKMEFLVSFLVDARGGAMQGSRRSGIRIVIPPRCAEQPVRITCRQLRPENVLHCPPLSEGEGLACRVLQLTPAKFLAPVLLEVPHFSPIGEEREIVVMRSDSGKKWCLHHNSAETGHLTAFLATSISNLTASPTENNNPEPGPARMTSITTTSLPQFFAVLSRPRQEARPIGPEGGVVASPLLPEVECLFPPRALTKPIPVGLSICAVPQDLADNFLSQTGSASPICTVEPRRRKFHRPITVRMPLPQPNPANEDTLMLLLCSMSAAGSRALWEDVTQSTPLSIAGGCVQFTTVVSAQFWLLSIPSSMSNERIQVAERLYKAVTRVPYTARVEVYWREGEEEGSEAEVRVVISTEGERVSENSLEEREGFTQLLKSGEVEVVERGEVVIGLTGNLEASGTNDARLQFRPFVENRVTFAVKRPDHTMSAAGMIQLSLEDKVLFSGPLFLPLDKSKR